MDKRTITINNLRKIYYILLAIVINSIWIRTYVGTGGSLSIILLIALVANISFVCSYILLEESDNKEYNITKGMFAVSFPLHILSKFLLSEFGNSSGWGYVTFFLVAVFIVIIYIVAFTVTTIAVLVKIRTSEKIEYFSDSMVSPINVLIFLFSLALIVKSFFSIITLIDM